MGILADLTAKVGELTVKAADKLENNWKAAAYVGAAYVVWNGLIKFETMRFCSQCIIPENCGINLVPLSPPVSYISSHCNIPHHSPTTSSAHALTDIGSLFPTTCRCAPSGHRSWRRSP